MRNTPGPQGLWRGNRVAIVSLVVLLVVGALGSAGTAQAQDARAIMQKVAQSYQNLTGYDGSATVDIKIIGKEGATAGKALQSQSLYALLKFQKPNKLSLDMTAPSGSRRIYCDGKDFYVFDALTNQFTHDPAPADGKKLAQLLLLRAGVVAVLDPLWFLTEGTLPPQLGDLKVKGTQKVNGRDTIVISGVSRTPRIEQKLTNGRKFIQPATTRNWVWWIDKQDYLIRRVEARIDNLKAGIPVRQGKKTVLRQLPVYNLSRHTVAAVKPNAPLGADVFQFKKPPTATEKKSLRDLLQGSQQPK
jgi:outer membrane lipoprotein-sorting protein